MDSLATPLESDEEIEGYERRSDEADLGEYPLDDVMVRSETRTVSDVVKRIEGGRYILDPDFQRDFIWEPDKQSKLIESCVMRIPLPVFYVAEMTDGRVAVVDGLQRLSTFRRFLGNDLKIVGLGADHPISGMTFQQLPINLQERIEDTQITLYILDKEAPDRARLDIFERVNSGVPLSRQQMRNAIYNGPATRWLSRMADGQPFKLATGGSLNRKTMRDREAINRFVSFKLMGWKAYRNGDMDEFLAEGLRRLNRMQEAELDELGRQFEHAMKLSSALFGKHSFRKSLKERNPHAGRTVLNISLFDALSVSFAHGTFERDDYPAIAERLASLVENYQFENAITYSTNSTASVATRFSKAEAHLAEFSR